MGCEGYDAIAGVYDVLNEEIDYGSWADFLERCFDRYCSSRPELVLDLACGTGRMTREMAKRGYDMIGVDGSDSMLGEAYDKSEGMGILYLCQDMRSFELYGTVGAVLCCLDSMNYLLSEKDVESTLRGVHNYLDPNGLFLFDVNTPYRFRTVYGDRAYVLEDVMDGRNIYCGWQNRYDEDSGLCDFDLSLFEEQEDGSYRRSDEHQQERCYSMEQWKRMLATCGFELLGVFADVNEETPCETTERWYMVARALKS
ncbi:MAG: class I SAM-dependent methyltransferase [Clostridia bacterium]|nr:class I SAM-dependent methyltransferase [Clostridia bacterium]